MTDYNLDNAPARLRQTIADAVRLHRDLQMKPPVEDFDEFVVVQDPVSLVAGVTNPPIVVGMIDGVPHVLRRPLPTDAARGEA
ncbi:MAG: hypothetical protein F4Z60_00265 [Chloroflexi bacterium]|nr:hypothetical protein [Chloroflexota bacterium]